MNLDPLVQRLVTAGVGTNGLVTGSTAVPIFKNRMPATCTKGIMLRPPMQGIYQDNSMPGFYKSSLQVIVRAGLQADGDTISAAVMKYLTIRTRTVFNDGQGAFLMQVNHLLVDRLPIVYPRDDSSATEWSINFKICFCTDPI